jgi:hypothetical protein
MYIIKIIINTYKKIMNILKILAVLAVLVPSVAFAHTEARDTASNDVPEIGAGVRAETMGMDEVGFGMDSAEMEMNGTEDKDASVTDDRMKGQSDDGHGTDGLKDTGEDSMQGMDPFLNLFVDFSDGDAQEAVDAFLKLDDIKGESENKSSKNDDESGDVKHGDKEDGATSTTKFKKPKEIVILGSKIKDVVRNGKVEVRGWDPERKEVTIKPENVEGAQDFLDLVGATVASDKNIGKVAIGPEKIELEYAQPAKLFGFIPMSLTAKVVLSNKEKPKVKFPWYAFFTSDNAKEVEDEIDALSLAWGAIPDTGDTQMQDRAFRFQAVSNLLKASHDAESN